MTNNRQSDSVYKLCPDVDDLVEGRLVTHKHDANNWRLRDMVNHPTDPNWESGTYSRCHLDLRTNPKLRPFTIIFDLVSDPTSGHYVIRSAFVVKDIVNGTLWFDSFIFADNMPLSYPIKSGRTRYGTRPKQKIFDILQHMARLGYVRYKVGERPASITVQDWKKMTNKKTNTKHAHRHFCN